MKKFRVTFDVSKTYRMYAQGEDEEAVLNSFEQWCEDNNVHHDDVESVEVEEIDFDTAGIMDIATDIKL